MAGNRDLTKGSVTGAMLAFAGPMMLGNLLQQLYHIADTLIVGRYIGADALGAAGSAYTLMTFLTSVLIGLCMGSGAVFSFHYGRQDKVHMMECIYTGFVLIGGITAGIMVFVFLLERQILVLLHIPQELFILMQEYVHIIFYGLVFVFLYNYFAYLLRALGDSVAPLYFLGTASVLNVVLDLLFVVQFQWGMKGAAAATVMAQAASGTGLGLYVWFKRKKLGLVSWQKKYGRQNDTLVDGSWMQAGISGKKRLFNGSTVKELLRQSLSTSMQQSVMNFGILMIQGLVNSFGAVVMAAFAAAVKIDTFAYMPAQEFGNAFSLFISQNYGAGEKERIHQGTRNAFVISALFCLAVSAAVTVLAEPLMTLFVDISETPVIAVGKGYLRIEGAFYWGIGILFLLYGYFRGMNRPGVSLLLTVISLGTRVALAYTLAPMENIGVTGIWWAIPVGWILADITGIGLMVRDSKPQNKRI